MAIRVEAEEIRSTADDFLSESEDLLDIIKNAKALLDDLVDNGFEGAAATAYTEKFIELEPSLEEAGHVLEQIGEMLDSTADTFEEISQAIVSDYNYEGTETNGYIEDMIDEEKEKLLSFI